MKVARKPAKKRPPAETAAPPRKTSPRLNQLKNKIIATDENQMHTDE